MSKNNHQNRVLGRTGARKLTEDEVNGVAGGFIPTLLSVISTNGGSDQSLDS